MRIDAGFLAQALEVDLYNAGWNGAINPYPGVRVGEVAMQCLSKALFKKFQDKVETDAEAAALSLFLKCNEECRNTFPDYSQCSEADAIAIGEAKDLLYRFFYYTDQERDCGCVLNWSSIGNAINVGNGANIGSLSTDFASKVGTSTMATTDPLLHKFYVQAISANPLWSSVETTRSKLRGCEVVRGSRLSFVPKTRTIARTICTEPILNMLYQKGAAAVMEERLRQVVGIDLSKQQRRNRQLARLGSKFGGFGTIDLSSASDTISISLCKDMLPLEVFQKLMRMRCPVTVLPDGSEVELHMISSMGNAFTFPLQTMIFSAIVYGAYRVLGIPFLKPDNGFLGTFAVNGDDIIVDREAYNFVVHLLGVCGFKVNVEKSFNEGPFRESCGQDFWLGQNVRGVYIKTLRHIQDVYSAINRLNRWSAVWGIPLVNSVGYLRSKVRFLPIPFDEADDGGIKVPERSVSRRRFCPRTRGLQYRVAVQATPTVDVTTLVAASSKLRGWKLLKENPDTILLAAVAGTLRLGRIAIRSNERGPFKIKVRYSSSWDYSAPSSGFCHCFGDSWKAIIEGNLRL